MMQIDIKIVCAYEQIMCCAVQKQKNNGLYTGTSNVLNN